MSEPLRTTPAEQPAATAAEREALIERLLVAGLDHYFEGRYEQAVNVWTRVAFLERGHGRARAYIERARGALAERERQTEELIHRGIQAYDTGNLAAARELLTRAVSEGGVNETALVLLQRLGRVQSVSEPVRGINGLASSGPWPDAAASTRDGAGTSAAKVNWLATIGVSAVIAAGTFALAQPIASWLGERPVSVPAVESRPAEPLPTVRMADLRLARARDLFDSGRLHDALRTLEDIGLADPLRPEADRLAAEVQRQLLALAPDLNDASAEEASQ